MPRYIDADALIEYFERYEFRIPITELVREIETAPTVDAVEVVRCRECKNWIHKDLIGCTDFVKLCKWGGYMVGANGYCVYGERKEGAE